MRLTTLLSREREWMLFVDGENVTKRGQEALKGKGFQLESGPYWRRDVYLWLPRMGAEFAFFAQHRGGFIGQDFDAPRVRGATPRLLLHVDEG